MPNTDVTQARIQAVVQANPGIHTAQLATVLGLAWNTTMHHIRAMERDGMLAVHKIDGKLRLFDKKRGAFKNKVAAAVLQDVQNRKVAAYVLQHPGKNQRDLARALDLSTTAMHRRLSRMEEAGLLQRFTSGRCTLIHATDDLPDAFVEAGLRTPAAPKADVSVAPKPTPLRPEVSAPTLGKRGRSLYRHAPAIREPADPHSVLEAAEVESA